MPQVEHDEHWPAHVAFGARVAHGELGIRGVLPHTAKGEPRADCRHDHLSDPVGKAPRRDHLAGDRVGKARLAPAQEHCRVHRGYDGAAGRAQNPMGLGEERVEIAEVLEDESAHHRIERCVPEGQRLVQVVGDEADVAGSDPLSGLLQHRRREVDRRDPRARLDEPRGVPAGSASEVQHFLPSRVAERFANAWPLQGWQRVGIVIVDRRPPIVALAHPGERIMFAGHSARLPDGNLSVDHTNGGFPGGPAGTVRTTSS